MQSIPQDIGDPFFDPDMRNQVLIRHFVRRRLNKEELNKLTRLETASGEIYNVARVNGTIICEGKCCLKTPSQTFNSFKVRRKLEVHPFQ